MKENGILYSSWGYDQTNIDFYKVVKVSGSFATIAEIPSQLVRSSGESDFVAPLTIALPSTYVADGKALKRKIHGTGPGEYLKLTSYSHAWLWDGKEKRQTASGYGH